MSNIISEVERLLEPIVKERDLELVDIEFVKEGKDDFLRIYIDKNGGIDLNECSIVSEKLSDILDEEDLIEGAYYLDVSSPGAERPLKTKKDFMKHIGSNVFISLYVHIDGEKQFEGQLKDFSDDIATVEYRYKHTKKQVQLPYDKIAKARLAVML